jgi:hypothetical protein
MRTSMVWGGRNVLFGPCSQITVGKIGRSHVPMYVHKVAAGIPMFSMLMLPRVQPGPVKLRVGCHDPPPTRAQASRRLPSVASWPPAAVVRVSTEPGWVVPAGRGIRFTGSLPVPGRHTGSGQCHHWPPATRPGSGLDLTPVTVGGPRTRDRDRT